MSHVLSSVSKKDIPNIVTAEPFTLSPVAKNAMYALIVVGLAGLGIGLMGDHPRDVWVSFHINFVFWFVIAAASTGFSAVFHICNAQWVRPIRRIFESASVYFLFSVVPLIVLYVFGKGHLFEWTHKHIHGKGPWLEPNFVYIRDIIGVLVLAYISRLVVFHSLRRDIGAIRSGLVDVEKAKLTRWEQNLYDKYVADWSDDAQASIQASTDRMGRLSPAVVIMYALLVTMIAFDQMMSVDPHWYSTLFGVLIFMSGVYGAMAFAGIMTWYARKRCLIYRNKVDRKVLHDLGKLLFGFGIFWAYMFWSHYLPIWYGNLPEETQWIITRLRLEPWHTYAWWVLAMCFIIPFLIGLSRDLKQIPSGLALTGVIVSIGIWAQFYLLFMPTLSPDSIPLCYTDVMVTAGFLGVFVLCAASFLEKMPLIPVGDLLTDNKSH